MLDAHFHLDEEILSVAGLIASMDAAGVERVALAPATNPPLHLPEIFHTVVAPLYRSLLGSRLNIVHCCGIRLYQHAIRFPGEVDILGRRYPIFMQPDNLRLFEVAAAHPDRFLPLFFANPKSGEGAAELEVALRTGRVAGVKAHPYWHRYEIALLDDVAALCEERRLPMLIHLGAGRSGDFRRLPERFPKLRVLYAHAGVPYTAAVCEYARGRDNVSVDISSSAYVGPRTAARAIERAGAERVLYGNDGPYFHTKDDRYDFRSTQDGLHKLGLSPEAFDRVARGNARALFNLD